MTTGWQQQHISIHAPARGATGKLIDPHGVVIVKFQSTLPHGERLKQILEIRFP